jgi:hypothetical protein
LFITLFFKIPHSTFRIPHSKDPELLNLDVSITSQRLS